ncbi:exopolyphosphatase [Beijerinckia indica]|uniref:exopolyphosphatase n=1 Tax=Beijerinckia indica subsp. indica (strain ATCC 9039 / DSM 1715 / NCIMB 8712) TaxID=395963 RepID=B2IBB5_BEII9|nr:exopolyphosphatase [Beijerinckia indica]ACB95199.1 Ppx/GppA phosphatase [Beijerinckia indica subsp. indica ATCC 9039]
MMVPPRPAILSTTIDRPVAIVDIGSNSVRLVVYERLTRSPRTIFNEKSLCALGHGVVTTGRLSKSGVEKALMALRRFRVLCGIMEVGEIHVLATAAARDASNGAEFLAAATEAIGTPISLLSGSREAELSAQGVLSGVAKPDGVVGDLGGGSLELIDVKGDSIGKGTTLPLGGLALMDASNQNLREAVKIARAHLAKSKLPERMLGRTFYAVGGTWRALAKLHMSQHNYPMNIMHGYTMAARDASDLTSLVEKVNTDTLVSIESVNAARRPLLAYGAVVLDEIIRKGNPKKVMISTTGVREGLLYEKLDAATRRLDPLLVAAEEFNVLFARSPAHAEELCGWTDVFMASTPLEESDTEKRLRHAACLLSDVNWRAHPDYRGEESLNLVVNGSFIGIDHPGRAFLILSASYRYLGLDEDVNPQLRGLVSSRLLDKARTLAATLRVATVISGSMGGILPRTSLTCVKSKVILSLPGDLVDLVSERLQNRLKQLSRLIGREPQVEIKG